MSLNLEHHFLIAMPGMEDPYFARSLVYLLQDDDSGSFGIIVNKPVSARLEAIIAQSGERPPYINPDDPLYFGGPVSMDQAVIVHDQQISAEHSLTNGKVTLSTSLTALHQMTQPPQLFFCMGYAGWGQGQLEDEMKENAWLSVEADYDTLFNAAPEAKYDMALRKLGIDPLMMSSSGGKA